VSGFTACELLKVRRSRAGLNAKMAATTSLECATGISAGEIDYKTRHVKWVMPNNSGQAKPSEPNVIFTLGIMFSSELADVFVFNTAHRQAPENLSIAGVPFESRRRY